MAAPGRPSICPPQFRRRKGECIMSDDDIRLHVEAVNRGAVRAMQILSKGVLEASASILRFGEALARHVQDCGWGYEPNGRIHHGRR